jgi:hypothetical protein
MVGVCLFIANYLLKKILVFLKNIKDFSIICRINLLSGEKWSKRVESGK